MPGLLKNGCASAKSWLVTARSKLLGDQDYYYYDHCCWHFFKKIRVGCKKINYREEKVIRKLCDFKCALVPWQSSNKFYLKAETCRDQEGDLAVSGQRRPQRDSTAPRWWLPAEPLLQRRPHTPQPHLCSTAPAPDCCPPAATFASGAPCHRNTGLPAPV